MNRKSIYIFTLMLIVWPIYSIAACPDPNTVTVIPKLVDVKVKTSISLDEKTGIYSYSYSIENRKENIGCIWRIEIDIKKPDGGVDLPKEGLINAKRFANLDIPNEDAPPMIPVTFPSLPKANKLIIWSAGLTGRGQARWNSNRYTYQIMPGDTITGLVLTTYGLPSIRDFKIKPKYIAEDKDLMEMFGLSEITEGEGTELLSTFYENISFKGKTLGPTAPPANFVALDFLSYLIDLKHQAFELGWIGGPKLVEDLDKKLDQAKEKLQDNNIESARGKLKSFINKLEAHFKETKEHEIEKAKHDEDKKFVTSEGYGLLKFNAKYLMDQLGEGEPKEDED